MSVITPIVDTLVRKETPEAKAVSGFFGRVKSKLLEEPGRALAADQAASANKQKEIKANYKRPGYDQTPLEKTRRTAANAAWDPATSKEPVSPVISRKNRQGIGNSTSSPGTFNGKVVNVGAGGALTLGGNPVKEAMFIKSEAAKGLVPQAGTASAIPGMQQNPALTTPGGNMTALLDQDTALFSAQMGAVNRGESLTGPGFGGGSQVPGGAPQIGDRAYRDLEKNITDMRNQQKALMSGNYSPSAFGTLSPTRRMAMAASLGEQIKGMEDTLFNRSSLANDLVKALLAAQAGKETTAMTANAGTEQARIKAGADIFGKQIDAEATLGAGVNTAAATQQKEKSKLSLDALGKLAEPFNKKMERGEALTPEEEEQYKSIQQQISMYAYADGGDDNLPAMPSFGSK